MIGIQDYPKGMLSWMIPLTSTLWFAETEQVA